MGWPFTKFVGSGNDFILFDNRTASFPHHQPGLVQKLCHRQWGIGADGVLLLELSMHADCRMRILNSDGSEAEMCGNGLRCFVKWLNVLGFRRQFYRIEVMNQIVAASNVGEQVCIEMGFIRDICWNIPLQFEDRNLTVHHLNTGVPHTLLFVDHVDQIDLATIGPYIRHHPFWKPRGTNVTILQQVERHRIKIRTYERGIEGETLACGTGATAAALSAAYQRNIAGPIVIETRSGEELTVNFSLHNQQFSHVTLTGGAHSTFKGEIDLDSFIYTSNRLDMDEVDYLDALDGIGPIPTCPNSPNSPTCPNSPNSPTCPNSPNSPTCPNSPNSPISPTRP